MTRTKQTARGGKNKRKAPQSEEEEDDFISADEEAPKSKKSKTTPAKKTMAESAWDLDTTSQGVKRAVVTEFKGNTYVNIREFYKNKDGEFMPGKKGIMLNLEAYTALVKAIPEINGKLAEAGVEIDVGGGEDDVKEDGEDKAVVKAEKKKGGKGKANIEATSEEEEEEEVGEESD